MKNLTMDNSFFIVSLCVVSVITLYGSWFVSLVSVFVIIFVFSDRIKKIERRWRDIDEDEGKKRDKKVREQSQ